MLKRLGRMMMRIGGGRTDNGNRARRALVEGLEARSLLSATVTETPRMAAEEPDVTPPILVKEQLIGTDPRAVEGVILTFSEPLDEASAEELKHYRIGVRTDRRLNYDNDNSNRNSKGQIRFESAVYDPANLTVTLTPVEPFNITRRFRTIRVLGRENQTVRDLAGNRIDGNGDGRPGGDAIEKFTFRRGGSIPYGDSDGDSVSLRLSGPGRIWVLRKTAGGKVLARGDAVRVYIEDARPDRSVLTGKVTGKGNNVAIIDELVAASTADVRITGDPMFQINRIIA